MIMTVFLKQSLLSKEKIFYLYSTSNIIWKYFNQTGGNKRSYLLNTNIKLLTVGLCCVSMYDLFFHQTLKFYVTVLWLIFLQFRWMSELVNGNRFEILKNIKKKKKKKMNRLHVTKYMHPANFLKSKFWQLHYKIQ